MIEAFDSPFTASHDLPDFSVGEILNELQDEKMLSLWRQLADEPEKRILLFSADKLCLGMVTFGRQHRDIIDGDFLFAAAVTMPVGNQVVRNAIQPGRKWNAAVCVIVNVVHRSLKNASGEAFRVVRIPRPVVNVIEYTVNVLCVEFSKGISIPLRCECKYVFFVGLKFRH